MSDTNAAPSNWEQAAPSPPSGPGGPRAAAPAHHRPRRRLIAGGATLAMLGGFGVSWLIRPGSTPASAGTTSSTLSVTALEAKVDPGLVDVVSTLGYEDGEAAGTGLVLSASGEILTNNHVIDGATSIKVTDLGNGRTYTAAVVGYDTSADVAVLQLQGASGLKTVTVGNSSKVTVGQAVVALGNAGGTGGTPSESAGSVTTLDQSITASDEGSGLSEQLTGLIETDATLEAGDSGGPLLNTAGRVIALDTAASSSSGPGVQAAAVHSYAIPINEAVSVAQQIVAHDASSTIHIGTSAFLGVEVASTGADQSSGAAVFAVVSGSPAANAGITAGEVISALGSDTVTSAASLSSLMNRYAPGDKITVTWTDEAGQSHTATVVAATGPAA